MSNKFNIRLRALREERGLTQERMAEKIGKSKSSVNMYERGEREPGLDTLEAIADLFNVDIEYLLGYSEIKNKYQQDMKNTANSETSPNRSNVEVINDYQLYQLPVFENAAAGFGALASDYIVDYMPVPLRSRAEAEESLIIRVVGDSMSPKIENGDFVQVRRQSSVDSGDLAVVLLDGEDGLIKKVIYGPDFIRLVSLNPEYKPLVFEGPEVLRLSVVGKVQKIIREP